MNIKMIETLKEVVASLNKFIELAEENTSVAVEEVVEEKTTSKIAPKVAKKTAPATSRKEKEEAEKLPDVSNGVTEEELNGLSYNNLKKVAKEMGITAVGSRDELTQKILSGAVEEPEEVAEEEVEEEPKKTAPAKNTAKNKGAVKPKKLTPAPVEEVEEEPEDEEVDPVLAMVEEATADMTEEEIMDYLASVGVRAKGKRQALISAVVKAVNDGKIELEDDGEEEQEEETVENSVETVETETEDTEEDSEEFDVNDTDNPDMTKARKKAIQEFIKTTEEEINNGEYKEKDLIEWLNSYTQSEEDYSDYSLEDLMNEYIYYSCLFIDDDGEMPDEGAYSVNGVPYCCGHELKYNDDNKTYICENCGEEYEVED